MKDESKGWLAAIFMCGLAAVIAIAGIAVPVVIVVWILRAMGVIA